jgi:protein-disulfide isomerase
MIKFLQNNAYSILLLCACIIVFGLGFVGYQITRDVLVIYKNRLVTEVGTQVSPQMKIESSGAQSAKHMTKDDIEEIVKNYILKNPSAIIDSLESMQANTAKEQNEKNTFKIKNKQADLFDTTKLPYSGNPNANIKIAIFQDYRCGYCKKANAVVDHLLQSDDDVLVVYHLLPILGPESLYAAKAALSVHKIAPNKFKDFHKAIMLSQISDESSVDKVLEAEGIDLSQIKKEMQDKEIGEQIKSSYDLASDIGVNGVPAIIINDQLFPGAIDLESLKKLVAEAKNKNIQNRPEADTPSAE